MTNTPGSDLETLCREGNWLYFREQLMRYQFEFEEIRRKCPQAAIRLDRIMEKYLAAGDKLSTLLSLAEGPGEEKEHVEGTITRRAA